MIFTALILINNILSCPDFYLYSYCFELLVFIASCNNLSKIQTENQSVGLFLDSLFFGIYDY